MPLPRHLGLAGRWAASALQTLVFWTVGLGLTVLLAVQLYVAVSNQLEVPAFVTRALEARLAAGGMHASFGRTRFDPSGRILIEDVRVTLAGSEEPLITASSVYARLDLWALLRERFEPLELQLTGASLRVPAMLSPSGQADEIVRDLSADLLPRGAELEVGSLNFRLGELAVSAHGVLQLDALQSGQHTPLPLTVLLAQKYGVVTKQFAAAISLLGVLDHPILQLELAPSESHGALVAATLVASGLRLPAPSGLQLTSLRLTSDFPLLNSTDPLELDARAAGASLPRFAVEGHYLRARLRADRPAGRVPGVGDLKFLDLSAGEIVVQGVTVRSPSIFLVGGPWPKVHAEIHAQPLDAPLFLQADVDFAAKTASAQVEGQLAPAVLEVIGARIHHDLRLFVRPTSPIAFSGNADFGAGWKFLRAGGRFSAHDLDTCTANPTLATRPYLRIDEVSGRLEYDGRRLVASELSTHFGDNFARGSYEMDVPTLRYRFLLSGKLRPLDINAWFPNQPWWSNLFGNFQFPLTPPFANMEWSGQWPTDHETRLFLSVDAPGMAIQHVPFDRVYGRLFIRPHFDDGLEFLITKGASAASGTFSRWFDQKAGIMRRLDLDLVSTLDLSFLPKVWVKNPPEVLTAFAFDQPPAVKLSGRFDWPVGTTDVRKVLHLQATTGNGFSFHGFALDRTTVTAEVKNDDFVLEPFTFGFAGGAVAGHVEVHGAGQPDGRMKVTAELKGANLLRAVELVQNYSPKGPPAKPVSPGEFLRNMANVKLDLSVAAEGAYADPLSYRGQGKAAVQGPELTKISVLGPLTKLLPFAQLRFTTARADFTISGKQITFPDVTVTGANSSIDARGTYTIDAHALDFNATVHPLRESKSLPGRVFSLVLEPLSQLTQVRLIGTPDKPQWTLAANPFNILRGPAPAAPTPLAHPAPAPAPSPAYAP